MEELDRATLSPAIAKTHFGESSAMVASSMSVKGGKSIFSVVSCTPTAEDSDSAAEVLATFTDGTPAAIRTVRGQGVAIYFGYHVGFSYFAPAVPLRPVDRSSVDAGFSHTILTEFDVVARRLAALPLDGVPGAVPVNASNPLVEVGIITADGKRQEGSSFPSNAVELLVVIIR